MKTFFVPCFVALFGILQLEKAPPTDTQPKTETKTENPVLETDKLSFKIKAPPSSEAGHLVRISYEGNPKLAKFDCSPSIGTDFLTIGKEAVSSFPLPGQYTIIGAGSDEDELILETQVITVSGSISPLPPPVIPDPPPVIPPDPNIPPGPKGLKVLFLEELNDRSKLPQSQLAILQSTRVRDWLIKHAAKSEDGKTVEARFWDDDYTSEHLRFEKPHWKGIYEKAKIDAKSLPWLLLQDSIKNTQESVPLPKIESEIFELFKKYETN